MTTSHDSSDAITGPARNAGGRWLYPLLLAVQTVGVIVIYRQGLPLFRQLVHDVADFPFSTDMPVWALTAITLIQSGYWVGHRLRPALPHYVNPLLGHVALFVARLVFLVASAAFSFVFILNTLETYVPVFHSVLLLVMLFSLFCYTLELERLGRILLGTENKLDRTGKRG